MPNVAALLKEEITRLARKQVRGTAAALKKTTVQHRHAIAALRRQIEQLQRQVATLGRRLEKGGAAAAPVPEKPKVRFVPRGLRSHRARLGLSAAEYGKLVGVSAQSIYNWEQGAARPRAAQLAALVALRGIGKREAQARLQQSASSPAQPRKRSARR
jgi:DNA-binding XRE family transcriptional regulator